MTKEYVVYVGNKPVMNYVFVALIMFNEGAKEVTIKARGKAISKAVSVAEVVRKRFLPDVTVKSIKTGTEELESEQGRKVNVSTIEIVLAREAS